jgi:uncharacterized membrane protein YhiD involved in acid resistance
MIDNFISDASIGLVLIMAVLWVLLILLKMAAGKLAGHMRNDRRRKGGVKAHMLRATGRTFGQLLKWWLFGRHR